MIYVASPYSGTAGVRQSRYGQVRDFCAHMFYEKKLFVYSPINHWHPVAVEKGCVGDFQQNQQADYDMLSLASEMFVLCLPGWQESVGVNAEIDFCLSTRKKIVCYDSSYKPIPLRRMSHYGRNTRT